MIGLWGVVYPHDFSPNYRLLRLPIKLPTVGGPLESANPANTALKDRNSCRLSLG